MLITVKLFILAALFVITGGAVFSDLSRRMPILVGLASLVSIVGAFYLFRDIYDDLKSDVVTEVSQRAPIGGADASQAAPVTSLGEIGPLAVWSPPENVDLYNLCRADGCVIDAMERHGASSNAVESSKLLEQFGSEDSYFYGFRELGGVDAAFVNYPFIMSEGNFLAFVNGRPKIMFAGNLLGGAEGKSLLSRDLQSAFRSGVSPDIWAFLEVRSSTMRSSDGENKDIQDVVTVWDVRDACRACEILGTVEIIYSFWRDGAFLGYSLGRVEKN